MLFSRNGISLSVAVIFCFPSFYRLSFYLLPVYPLLCSFHIFYFPLTSPCLVFSTFIRLFSTDHPGQGRHLQRRNLRTLPQFIRVWKWKEKRRKEGKERLGGMNGMSEWPILFVTVQCVVYSVRCTVCGVQCAVCSVRCTHAAYSLQWEWRNLQHTTVTPAAASPTSLMELIKSLT